MKCLERNKQYFQYATANGKTAILDNDGYKTGEYSVSYANIKETRGNICLKKTFYKQTLQGIVSSVKSTIILDTANINIVDKTILWIGFGHIEAFNNQNQYQIGQYCINGSSVYVCKKSTTIGEPFSIDEWEDVPNNYIISSTSKSINSTLIDIEGVDHEN